MLCALFVNDDFRYKGSDNLGTQFFNADVLLGKSYELFHIIGRGSQAFDLLFKLGKPFGDSVLFLVVSLGQHAELFVGDFPKHVILV